MSKDILNKVYILPIFTMEYGLLIPLFALVSLNIYFSELFFISAIISYILYHYCNFCQIKICIYGFFELKYNSRLRLSTEAEYS